MKKIAILGGSRFIGFHLLWTLNEQGHDVTIFNRLLSIPPAPFPKGITYVKGDRNNPEDLKRLFHKKYDVVIDLHGWKSGHVEPMIRCYRDKIGHYIYLSTTGVYKKPVPMPMNENSPRDFNGENKAIVEELLLTAYREQQFPVTIFRPHGVIGAYDACSVGLIFYRLKRALPLFFQSQHNTRINYLYVHDLIKAFMLAMNNPKAYGEAYVIAGDDIMTPAKLTQHCADMVGVKSNIKFIDTISAYTNPDYIKPKRFVEFCIPWAEFDQVIDNNKIKNDLGMQFTSMQTVLEEIYSWLTERSSHLNYFALPGEQYILTGRAVPFLMRLRWKLMELVQGFVKSIQETMKQIQMIQKSYCYIKSALFVQNR